MVSKPIHQLIFYPRNCSSTQRHFPCPVRKKALYKQFPSYANDDAPSPPIALARPKKTRFRLAFPQAHATDQASIKL